LLKAAAGQAIYFFTVLLTSPLFSGGIAIMVKGRVQSSLASAYPIL